MESFQQCLLEGILDVALVKPHNDLYSHFDIPAPGVGRLTYVRLSKDRKTVTAFLSCVMNGQIEGSPCIAFGYAVPEKMRNQGLAKQILRDVIYDQVDKAGKAGHSTVYVEAVVDVTNTASQRVSESVLAVGKEEIVDSVSKRPAYRYTKLFDTE
jgi:predicted acetyltransferase